VYKPHNKGENDLNVLAFFTDAGVPRTGLTPTVRIRDIADNSLVITDAAASEVGDGWYKYNFTQYDSTKEYGVRFDGGPALSDADRYTSGTNDSFSDDITDAVFQEQINEHLDAGSFGYVINEINLDLKRTLGLMHENIFIDETVYDGHGNLQSARVRIYSDSSSVGSDFNVIGTYTITSSSSETGKFDQWAQVKV
jgi:hypothetical protein